MSNQDHLCLEFAGFLLPKRHFYKYSLPSSLSLLNPHGVTMKEVLYPVSEPY